MSGSASSKCMNCGVAMKDMKKPGIAKNEAGSIAGRDSSDGSLAGFIKRPQAVANRRVKR
ncbi:hypothetical protein [Diaphorobacter aerolatus]|uniref:Uncharacterized protein n=1 Tax=Diaphorobacter aerolatus TaxID=1288495 RepID=A0A7H0GQW1_9BURK|nr:hypothetical protein [Diaphorobacter aerolatus]QNP50677.1 hypothetical protein H9K75_13735 [Diaphorobacter aerolatus]